MNAYLYYRDVLLRMSKNNKGRYPPVEKKTVAAESPTQAQAAKKKAQIRYGITYPIGWTVIANNVT